MSTTGGRHRPLRGDIEGMRAVAVLMVLLYHARVPGVSGGFAGVDVFFVISGFLITSLLIREVQVRGTVSLTIFYARRARRLLPAASVVLVFSGLVGFVILPKGMRTELGGDILASTFYVVNWALAGRSVDYLAEDAAPSVVQHYWSLSVEEQFYLLWPLLILVGTVLAARFSLRPLLVPWFLLAVLTVASLTWSIAHTAASPDTAYFATTTRLWELGIGGLLAFVAPHLKALPRHTATALAGVGLALVVGAATAVGAQTPWPGSAALLPVLGTALVIAAGCSTHPTLPGRALGVAPMLFVGGISYSLYLWHWPLLVFLGELRPDSGLASRLAVIALAVALAYATKVVVEDPVRFRQSLAERPKRVLTWSGVAALTCTAVAAALLTTAPRLPTEAPGWARGATELAEVDSDAENPDSPSAPTGDSPTGERAKPVTTSGPVFPDPEVATLDVPALYEDGCQVEQDSAEIVSCDYGDTSSDVVVAVVGDSKVAQWLPALAVVGRQEGWLIRTYTKSACSWSGAEVLLNDEPYGSCVEWGKRVLEALTGPEPPALVVTSSGRAEALAANGSASAGALADGYAAYWSKLLALDTAVVALADNPHPGNPVYTCVGEHRDDYSVCDFPRGEGVGTPALRDAAVQVGEAHFVDLTDWICNDQVCPAVVGQVLVYRQGSHVTATYAETAAPLLRQALLEAMPPRATARSSR